MRLTWISVTALAAVAFVSAVVEIAAGPDPATAAARWIAVSSTQTAALVRMAPLHVLWSACGILGGLVLRQGVPLRRSHSSPTAAWVAKRAMAASAVAVAAFGMGCMRFDAGWIHVAAALHAAGWLAWLRNLPARL